MTYYFKNIDGCSFTICGERGMAELSIDPNWQEITEEEYNALTNPPKSEDEMEAEHLSALRSRRSVLLEAFDKYKTNLAVSIEILDEASWEKVVEWYHDLLDLKESAFENIPERVQYYLGGTE